jgi:Flp pilus assembly protein TadD
MKKSQKLKIKSQNCGIWKPRTCRPARQGLFVGFQTVLLIVYLALPVQAGVGSSSGADFLRLGGGARPLALGEAYTALANDASSLFYNPAGFGRMSFPEVLTMYNSWLADTRQQAAVVAYPFQFGVLALGYSSLLSGDIQGYDQNGALISVFDTGASALSVSYGRSVNPALFWGLSVKAIADRLDTVTARTTALDAGITYLYNPNLSLGASVLNYGAGLVYVSEKAPLPTCYRAGVAYKTALFNDDIRLAGDLAAYPDATVIDLGVEYLVRDFLALRLGDSGGNLRAGLGLVANILSLDYAYFGHQDLGATHQVSVSLLFGAPEETKKLALENMAYGKAFLKEGKYADAILRFNRVLRADPQNEEAALLVKKAQNELETAALERVFTQKQVEVKRSVAEIIASGKQFFDQGKYIEAVAEFGNALKIDPTNPEALRLQSQAQTKMETQLIEQSRSEAKEYLGEAMKLVITGNYAEALEPLNKALEKDPKNKQALELKKKLELIRKIQNK